MLQQSNIYTKFTGLTKPITMKKSKFFTIAVALFAAPLIQSTSYAQEAEAEQGNMVWILSQNVSPSNIGVYETWLKEFKAIADETGAPGYGVASNDQGISIFLNIGKTMAGYDELNKKFGEWFAKNPNVGELQKKYAHSLDFSESSVWRHNPSQSYVPEGYDNSGNRPYTRITNVWINTGQMGKANDIIGEYVAEWTKSGIKASTNTYWNVFGEEQDCVAFVTNYESFDAWAASRAEVEEKVGQAKLNELQGKLGAISRRIEESESFGRPDLAHSN